MSDETPAVDEPDDDEEGRVRPRHQTAAERRSSETVMLDSGSLGDMVSAAKGADEPPAPSVGSASDSEFDDEEQERKNVILIIGVAVLLVLAGLVGYLIYIVPD